MLDIANKKFQDPADTLRLSLTLSCFIFRIKFLIFLKRLLKLLVVLISINRKGEDKQDEMIE
jgi:hypothetical protein